MKQQTVTFYHDMRNQDVHAAYLELDGRKHLCADLRHQPGYMPDTVTIVTSQSTLIDDNGNNMNASWKRMLDQDVKEGFLSKTELECNVTNDVTDVYRYMIVQHRTIGEHLSFGGVKAILGK